MIVVGRLWRLPPSAQPDHVTRQTLLDRGFAHGISIERDPATRQVLVGFFVAGERVRDANVRAETAMRAAFGTLFDAATVEWSGIADPTPDLERPETLPSIPTLAALMRRRPAVGMPETEGRPFRVRLRLAEFRGMSVSDAARGLREAIRDMEGRPTRVHSDDAVGAIRLEITLRASSVAAAEIAGLQRVEELASAAFESSTECHIAVEEVDEYQ